MSASRLESTQKRENEFDESDEFDEFDVLELMMPTFSGIEDEYGKESFPPPSLSFDRVCEGRKPSSNVRLFSLPVELLAKIALYIPKASLASFAFVNSDCRQLARSRLFASVQFDYSDHACDMILSLLKEETERLANYGSTKKPALGACIRRITIATHPGWITYRHNIELSEKFTALPEAVKTERRIAANKMFFGSYLPSIQSLISNRAVLPHLELLDFEDRATLSPSFFNAIIRSTIQHLRLNRVGVNKVFTVNNPLSHSTQSSRLRSLYLDIIPSFGTITEIDTSPLSLSLVHLCASTLEALTWCDCTRRTLRTNILGPNPKLPSLRYLRLDWVRFEDDSLLQELIHDDLKAFEGSTDQTPASFRFFDSRGCVPGLETFVWSSFLESESASLSFLEANSQISKFSIPSSSSETLLNQRIIPLLLRCFHNLKSLNLTWDSMQISSTALEQISSIKTLEQLHLSAGFQAGWRHDWPIDHPIMRRYLSTLPLLKRLAFSRDSYSNGVHDTCERYYSDEFTKPEDLRNLDWTSEMFKEEHRNRMLREAEKYVADMPLIEWFYFGKIPMAVEWKAESGTKVARPLANEMDDAWTALREMFGWKGLMAH